MKIYNVIHIFSLLLISILSIFLSFFPIEWLRVVVAIGISLLLMVLIVKTSGFLRIIYSTFLITSLFLSIYYQLAFEQILNAYNSYALFIALFVFTPLINIPIEAGRYLEKLIPKITGTATNQLSRLLLISNYVLGSFINIGGIRVIGDVFFDYIKKSPKKYGIILTRSFGSAAFWTPYFSAFSVAVSLSNSEPSLILFYGLIFSLLVITYLLILFIIKEPKAKRRLQLSKVDKQTIWILFIYFALLVLIVVLLTHFTNLDVIAIISFISILYSFLWSFLTGNFKEYKKSFKKFVTKDLLNVREEAFLFISVGFLVNTLLNIGWDIHLPTFFVNSNVFIFLFVIIFIGIVASIALTGIHHLVTITVMTTAINWQTIGIDPVVYGLMILFAWGISITVSPFSPPNLITARITGQTPFQIGIKNNGIYGLCLLFGSGIYLAIVNSFLV